jgi:hypothetical protein
MVIDEVRQAGTCTTTIVFGLRGNINSSSGTKKSNTQKTFGERLNIVPVSKMKLAS